MIGAASVVGWVMAVGLVVAIGPALLVRSTTFGPPEGGITILAAIPT